MKHIIYLISVVLLFSACADKTCSTTETLVDVTRYQEMPITEVFDSFEFVTFDTSEESIIGRVASFHECEDYYLIKNSNGIIYVFDKQGHFIANSKKVAGHAKEEISQVLGFTYNPATKLIEVLTNGRLLMYDVNFNFVKSVKTSESNDSKTAEIFTSIYDLSASKHLLLSNWGGAGSNELFPYDSETNQVESRISFEEDVIVSCSWQDACFARDNGRIFVMPPYVTNCVYTYDPEAKRLHPYLRLDFGQDGFRKEDIADIANYEMKIRQACESKKPYAQQYAISGGKAYAMVHTGLQALDWYVLEIDTKTKEVKRFNIAENKKRVFPLKFYAYDGYVVAPLEDANIMHNIVGNDCDDNQSDEDYNLIIMKCKVK